MRDGDPTIQQIGFLLVPGFALMSFASASEPFRAANLVAGRELYRVRTFGETETVPSSSGMPTPVEVLPGKGSGLFMLFVCAGGEPGDWNRPEIHAALRRAAADGVAVGGISGGPFLLAAAGLLEHRRFTIHWQHAPALIEAFPHLRPDHARFVIDRGRLTCGGGIAPLDMMHALIAERMGADFARRVSDWFLHTEVASAAGAQRASLSERFRVHHPVLVAVLEKMIGTIESPLGREAMAGFAGVSPRHLDRLFAEHMHSTFTAQYRRIRLDHARQLVRQSPLSIAEIAFATGFSSAGHLSRRYLEAFGEPPGAHRKARSPGG